MAQLTWSQAMAKLRQYDEDSREGFVLPSDEPVDDKGSSLHIGLTTDKNTRINMPDILGQRHTAIVGQSGVGKTTLGEYILWQQTARGRGWLFIDAKIDRDTRDHLAYMAKVTGREDELYIIDVSDPDNANTYNPVLHGDPDEVASRLMNLIPSAENNPGADHYRQSANHALTVIIAALQASGQLYHFGDLSILLQSDRALENLERMTPQGPEKRALSIFLDQFRTRTKEGTKIDLNRMKQTLGGMAGRIALFAQGKFGKVFNVYAPEIVLTEIIRKGHMLYVSLPTMGKDTAALNLGKMIVSDIRSAVAYIQDLPKSERPEHFIALLDEMGAYVMEGVGRLFEQARSANIALIPAFQSFSQLNRVSPDFADIVIQNTWNKIFFKFGAKDSPEEAAEILGKTKRFQRTVSVSANQGESAQYLRTTPQSSMSDGGGMGESWREVEEFRVTPDQLRAMDMGQAVMMMGARMYHLRTPMINYPKHIPSFKVIKRKMKIPSDKQALNFEERLNEFLTATA
ncbi:type IV secretory system conjugative DNA transfer family protein [Vreelandella neptunia]|uniref:type IV secretory system conjugative DNA transfer family protein n=1 Tax=Vreelandella neptunia TaxID=115551 RepID=UPI00315A9865